MLQRWRFRKRCRNLAKRCAEPVLSEYLLQSSRMKPGHIENTPMIAADLELTGLKSEHNRIIAIGTSSLAQLLAVERHCSLAIAHQYFVAVQFHLLPVPPCDMACM